MEILDITFNNFQKEPEKYVKYLLKFFIDKEEREFKTNDGIKFSLDYQKIQSIAIMLHSKKIK